MNKITKIIVISFIISLYLCAFAISDSTQTYCFTIDAGALNIDEFESGMKPIGDIKNETEQDFETTKNHVDSDSLNKDDSNKDATDPVENEEVIKNDAVNDNAQEDETVPSVEINNGNNTVTNNTEPSNPIENESNNIIVQPKPNINLNNYHSVLFYGGLTSTEVQLIEDLLDGYNQFYQQQDTFDVTVNEGLGFDSYHRVLSWFAIYFMNWDSLDTMIDYTIRGNETTVTLHLDTFHEWNKHRNELLNKIEDILETIPEGTEIEKLDAIAEYLANNAVYDASKYNAYDLLFSQRGNCNAFALVFQHMCLRLEIQSDLCVGYSNSGLHAWVMCSLTNGDVVFYDLTFYKTNRDSKYLHGNTSPWPEYVLNNYY